MTIPRCPYPALAATWPVFAGLQVTAMLGTGGMGSVYAATGADGRTVALKILDPSGTRFRNEARASASVVHPRLVRSIDLGEVAGHPYLVMELASGGDVDGLRRREGGILPRHRLLAIARDAAEGLQVLHSNGIVHRDIKPSNLLLDADGRVALCDFGLARFEDGSPGMTRDGFAIGTPDYMAPEQARGEAVDGRADLYALGATLYHLAVGAPPHAGNTTWLIIASLLSDPFPDPTEHRPDLGADLLSVISTLGNKSLGGRYPSAAEVIRDLDLIISGSHPVFAKPSAHSTDTAVVQHANPTILLVDDDPLARRIYATGLRQRGLACIEAADAASGIAAAQRHRPVAAVVDLMLPDLDGSEVIRRLRADHPSLPVIVLSNAFAVEHLAQARAAGADAVLSKERVAPSALAEAVGRMLPQSRPAPLPHSGQGVTTEDITATADTALARIQLLLHRLSADRDEGAVLGEVATTARGLATAAAAAGAEDAGRLAAALEALARELIAQPERRSSSTRRTLTQAATALRRSLSSGARPLRSPRALAVDDDRTARTLLDRALSRVGIGHTVVETPDEALATLRDGGWDLLVTDVVMDGMTGFQLASRVRALPGCADMPVLFATGIEDFPAFFAADHDNGVDLIGKPYLLIELGVKALVLLADHAAGGPRHGHG